ncbi:MAG: hypothetical protein ABIK89_21135 [Planctomycetota bacterium]
MMSTRFLHKVKVAAVTALLAGGTLYGSGCTSDDLQKNIVAGTLGYVKGGATAFWNNFIPQDDLWAGFFNPDFY